MITFFKNQKDLANALRLLIDSYWNTNIKEEDFINQVKDIIDKNEEKMFVGEDYTSVISQRLGKRRTELIDKILKKE